MSAPPKSADPVLAFRRSPAAYSCSAYLVRSSGGSFTDKDAPATDRAGGERGLLCKPAKTQDSCSSAPPRSDQGDRQQGRRKNDHAEGRRALLARLSACMSKPDGSAIPR